MERDEYKLVEVTVGLWIKDDADVALVILEMDYEFKHNMILDSEIHGFNTEI